MSHANARPQIARGTHLTLYAVLACVFIYAAVQRYRRPLDIQDHAPVEPERVAAVAGRIDPNTAGWAELARLPEIGESLAREIVRYREKARARRKRDAGRTGGSDPAASTIFRSIQDLDPVPGIGEKTLQRIAPYLKFPPEK